MSRPRLFVTGATGFIGRALLNRLPPQFFEVTYLARSTPVPRQGPEGARCILGSLEEPGSYADALGGADTVVHLAAVTGKARRPDYFKVNVGGTRTLLEQCRRHGSPRFVHVSSIAAGFENAPAYHYAASKRQAEESVRESSLPHVIVRPTVVLGAGSPVLQALARLAAAPVVPVFGDGRARVQPILVEDLADCLVDLVRGLGPTNETVDLGGPDVVPFETLLLTIRRALGRRPAPVVHLPVGAAIAVLSALEPVAFPILPVTAGQLSAFVNDSVARRSAFLDQRLARMAPLEAMMRSVAEHG